MLLGAIIMLIGLCIGAFFGSAFTWVIANKLRDQQDVILGNKPPAEPELFEIGECSCGHARSHHLNDGPCQKRLPYSQATGYKTPQCTCQRFITEDGYTVLELQSLGILPAHMEIMPVAIEVPKKRKTERDAV